MKIERTSQTFAENNEAYAPLYRQKKVSAKHVFEKQ